MTNCIDCGKLIPQPYLSLCVECYLKAKRKRTGQYDKGKRWCRNCEKYVLDSGNSRLCPICNRPLRFSRRNKKKAISSEKIVDRRLSEPISQGKI